MRKKPENLLRRMVEIQNITLEHTKRGITQEWIYGNLIYPRFYISKRQYYNYLSYPAKKELRELEESQKRNGA